MNSEQARKLREPFPPETVGKLPRVTCRDCAENKQQKCCQRHERRKCGVCDAYISEAHIHLDYVGHAATTDRLLQVDPQWTWEPVAFGTAGEPLMTNGGMWIKLTVAGVTRLGFGDGATVKEIIGDAIRNAAMRFGVALDLWAKEDLHAASGGEPSAGQHVAPPGAPVAAADRRRSEPPSPPVENSMEVRRLTDRLYELADLLDARETAASAVEQHRAGHTQVDHQRWLMKQIGTMAAAVKQRDAEPAGVGS